MPENSQLSQELNEIASTAMDSNAMNDMNMMYRRDGV